MKPLIAALALCVCAEPLAAAQDAAWPDLRDALYEDRVLNDGSQMIAIDAPYRTDNDARTHVAAHLVAPAGLRIGSVSVILDENPMPVSAVFTFDTPLPRFFFDVSLRINGPTPLHIVAETSDGQLFVAESFIKTSGQGACAAPPGTDPEAALATLGEMLIDVGPLDEGGSVMGQLQALSDPQRSVSVDVSHPSHSGMQMDQISLLFIPMRYVETLDIALDGQGYVDVTGSISLSENPRVTLGVPSGAQSLDVTMTDTDGTVTHAHRMMPGY
ncbi:quinoprotein dehydrogenase-associated SoxYZ-like carrier [Actibacterium ureilyticum]|uniref:quinoprotein dehydrogenase-associated SoxYZ-like carrier n=1 Tax=Actibacterium ureilyticum TaxID=1590614 RepID=UPI000BAAD9C3|nr:quinoprotein dehydrogenase-associated SoxYZ-like carrier [Actibacterium ureilyticum]